MMMKTTFKVIAKEVLVEHSLADFVILLTFVKNS